MAKKESRVPAKSEPARALSPFEEMERRFEDIFRRPFSLLGGPAWWPRRTLEVAELAPSVDIYDEDGDVVVKAELPGIKKEDVEVNLTDHMVTISGEKKKEEKVEDKGYYRLERSYGAFSRTFEIPTDVQTDKAKAKFHDGVLEIRLPKTEEAKKKAQKIAVE